MSNLDLAVKLFLQFPVFQGTCIIAGSFGRRPGQTQVVTERVAGVLLGPSLFGLMAPAAQEWIFPQQTFLATGGSTVSLTHPSLTNMYALSRIGLENTAPLWIMTIVIVALAIAGKGLACMFAAHAAGESWRESATVGTLMNARGLMELIILNIGLQAGVIRPTLFTMMVLMAVITTLMASPLFHLLYGRHMSVVAPARAPGSSLATE